MEEDKRIRLKENVNAKKTEKYNTIFDKRGRKEKDRWRNISEGKKKCGVR